MSDPQNGRRGKGEDSAKAKGTPAEMLKYAAVAMAVVLAFFAAYSYALGTNGSTDAVAQGGSGSAPIYDEYGNVVQADGSPVQPAIDPNASDGG